MARLVSISVAASVLIVSLFTVPSHSQCGDDGVQFYREPGMEAGSPLTCNILGADVVITCRVQREAVDFGWYYTTDRSKAGVRMGDEMFLISETDRRYSISTRPAQSPSGVVSDLKIQPYLNKSYDGFYWCKIVGGFQLPTGFLVPSQAVELNAEFTEDQLEPCSMLTFTTETNSCAIGENPGSPTIVVGAEFTNISTTTTDEMTTTTDPNTTTEPPTNATTETETTRRTTETTVGVTESGSNQVRTALIWFSVGAVVLLLLTVGIVLSVIACTKC